MAEPAAPIPRPRLELSLLEARTRFVQLARLANLTRQSTIVTEGGRPVAAIVPVDAALGATASSGSAGGASASPAAPAPSLPAASPSSSSSAAPASDGPAASASPLLSGPVSALPAGSASSSPGRSGGPSGSGSAAGGSAAGWLRRIETLRADLQRQHRALETALEEAWRELDRVRPPGSDPGVDALRLAHSDVRRRP
jgi:antitoxin (DNA-binding transcriptional repressor) of toxin-antitoxin stability system